MAVGAGSERGEVLPGCSLHIVMVTTITTIIISPPRAPWSHNCPGLPPSCPPNIPPSFCSSSLWAPLVVYCSTLVKLMFGSLYLEQFKGFWVTQNGGDNWVTFSLLF